MAEGHSNPALSSDSLTEADIDTLREETDSMEPANVDDNALQRFLQQQRSDLMYELRRIQYGERPVTGQNHRQQIANFVAKHVPSEPEGASSAGKNVPANVDSVEEHRPEAVVVEVQGVVEQRRVSSMLQSANFRRHLENIIRGSISSASQTVAASAARARANSSPRAATPEGSATAAHRTPQSAAAPRSSENATPPSSAVRDARPNARPPSNSPATAAPPRPPPLPEVSSAQPRGGEEEGGVWDSISQAHHEDMVYEISDLLHRRLVSSALGSEFRTVMELHVQEHLSQTRTDGQAVAEFIRSIPQSDVHVPNDFRHLGINPGPREDMSLSDNISITGLSATAVPYTQTNLHLSRELHSMKSQMEEMKNMLKLTFDLQMDIQRAIRQEVAAAIASATGQGGAAAAAAPEPRCTPVNDSHCLICLENHSDSVLYQCGHICVCFVCGKNLLTRGNGKCPVCRAPIKDVIRAYKSNVE